MHLSARFVYPMGLLALLLPIPALAGWSYPTFMPYSWHKGLHILGAVLFLGNIATGALWGLVAVRSREARTLRFALNTVNWSDAIFTGPGILLVMYNGLALAGTLGGVAANRFTLWGLALFVAVVAMWLAFVVPDQHRILARADEAASPSRTLRHAVLRWNIVGGLAGAMAFAVLALMVLKP